MKHLAITILAVAAFALGACARHDNAASSTHQSSTTSTGYSK